jgi:GT2 family glycosyltransferase
MPPQIGVVIVNWNRGPDTLRSIASVLASDYSRYEIVVVDNASTDGSGAMIRAAYPGLAFIGQPRNTGFSGGNNAGICLALEHGAEYVLLLNNDAVVEPATLGRLAAAAAAHPAAGFLGAVVYTLEDRRVVLSAGGRLRAGWMPEPIGLGEVERNGQGPPEEVDYLSGCALLASRSAIDAVGLLDEDLFLYFEDVEWCYRARKAGFQVLAVPGARAFHPDTRRRDQDSPVIIYYGARNSLMFAKKHRLGYSVALRLWLYYGRMLLSWSVRPRWRHKRLQRDALWRALRDYAAGRRGPGA